MDLHQDIAARLEQTFSQHGFAEPGVAALKTASGVSLRTLYRHFPSKESMVIGALAHRHARYLRFLNEDMPAPGSAALRHLFQRLGVWMQNDAPHGCLSMSALAAFPGNDLIADTVHQHKRAIILLISQLSGREYLAQALFLLHEGASAAWPLLGTQAIHAAEKAALQLIDGGTQ